MLSTDDLIEKIHLLWQKNMFQAMVDSLPPSELETRDHYILFFFKGVGLLYTGQPMEAINVLDIAINMCDDNPFARHTRGRHWLPMSSTMQQ